MPSPIDAAWGFLKSVDFADLGPVPTRYTFHPDSVPYEGQPFNEESHKKRMELYEKDPEGQQHWMEEDYIPDLQKLLELEALRQASGGRQVPRDLLMPRQEYGYEEEPWDRNYGATSSHEMLHLPQGGTRNLPLPQ